jgi:hypothetical protein
MSGENCTHQAGLAARLRVVHRGVAVAHERVRVGVRLGTCQRDADAHPHGEVVPVHGGRRGERVEHHPLRDRGGVRAFDAVEQQGELVAAEPGSEVTVAQAGVEPIGDRDEQGVTGCVAEAVVDGLEVVDVDEQDGEVAASIWLHKCLGQPEREQRLVGEPGQRIVVCLMG